MSIAKKSLAMIKILLAEIVVSIILLLIAAYVTLKMSPSDEFISYLVIAIYVIASLTGGFIAGKIMERKKFIWGFVAGALYVAIILGVTMIVKGNISTGSVGLVKMIVPSIAGGMFGGMIS